MSRIQVYKSQPYGNRQVPVVVRLSKPVVINENTNWSHQKFFKIDAMQIKSSISKENQTNLIDTGMMSMSLSSLSNSLLCSSSHKHNTVSLTYNSHCSNVTVPLMKPTLPANWIRFYPVQQQIPQMHVMNCMAPDCGTSFNIFTRKYHCKMCGRVYCAACCSNQIYVQISYCHSESIAVMRQSTNSRHLFQRSEQIVNNGYVINDANYNRQKQLRYKLIYSQLQNSTLACENNQQDFTTKNKNLLQNEPYTAQSRQHQFTQSCQYANFNKLEEKQQLQNPLSSYTYNKLINDNYNKTTTQNNQVNAQMQQLIKLPQWTHGQTTRQHKLLDQCQEIGKVVDVHSIAAHKRQSNLTTPTSVKCEEFVLQKANIENGAPDCTSNVPVQQDGQLQQNTKLITVYVCRACYYETQLVISKRQANGQLRRKSRGEFKMFQRALLVNILSFLTLSDLAQVALVASDFYFMAKDNVIWYQYNVRRWTLDTEQSQLQRQSNLSYTSPSSSLMWSGNPAQYRSFSYLNRFAALPSQPLLGQALPSSSSSYATLSSPQQHKLRAQGGPSSPLLTCSTSVPSFSQRGFYSAAFLSASNLQQAFMQDATALTVNEAARRVISLHSRYSFTQFLDFTRRQQMARCGGMAAFGVGYRILFSNPIKIAFLGPQRIGKTTCIRAFFDEDAGTSVVTHSTMGFTRYVRSIRLLGSATAQVPVHIYDLSGDERYEELWRLICRHCHVIALCYDASRKVTLIEAANMMLSVEHVLGPQPVITCGLIPDAHVLQQTKQNDQVQTRQSISTGLLKSNHIVPANQINTDEHYDFDNNKLCTNYNGNAINKINNNCATSQQSNKQKNNAKQIQSQQTRAASHMTRIIAAKAMSVQKQVIGDSHDKTNNGKLKRSLSYSSLLLLQKMQAWQQRQNSSQNYSDQYANTYDLQNINDLYHQTTKYILKSSNNVNHDDDKLLFSTVAGQTQTPPTVSLGVHRHPVSAPSTPTQGASHLLQSHVWSRALVANGKSRNGNRSVNNNVNNNILTNNTKRITPHGKKCTVLQKVNDKNNEQEMFEQQASKIEQPQASSITISEVYYNEQLPIPLDINRKSKRRSNQQKRKKVNGSSQSTSQLSSTSQSLSSTTVSPSQSDAKRGNGQQKPMKNTQNTKEYCRNDKVNNNDRSNSGSGSSSDNIKSNQDYISVHDHPHLQVSAQDSAEITVRGAGSVQCPVHDASLLFTHLLQCLVDQVAAATMATTATIADISQDVIGGESVHAQNDKHPSTSLDTHIPTTSSTVHSLTLSPQRKQYSMNNQLHAARTNKTGNNKQISPQNNDIHNKYSTTYANTTHKIHRQSVRKGNGKRYKVRQAVLQELLNISTQPSPLDVLLDFK